MSKAGLSRLSSLLGPLRGLSRGREVTMGRSLLGGLGLLGSRVSILMGGLLWLLAGLLLSPGGER